MTARERLASVSVAAAAAGAGAATAFSPLIVAALAGTIGGLLAGPNVIVAVLCSTAWPVLLLGPDRAGVATVALGGLLAVGLLVRPGAYADMDRTRRRGLLRPLLAMFAFGGVVAASSLPFDDVSLRRLLFFLVVSTPAFVAGYVLPTAKFLKLTVVFSGMLAAATVVLGRHPTYVNPIAIGECCALAILVVLVYLRGMPIVVRSLLLLLFAAAITVVGKTGPAVSLVVAFAWFINTRSLRTGRGRRLMRSHRMITAVLVLLLVVVGGRLIVTKWENDPLQGNNNARVRADAWSDVVHRTRPVIGSGASGFANRQTAEGGILVYPHNAFVDAYGSGGLVGLLFFGSVAGPAVVALMRGRDRAFVPFVVPLVESMFSSGLLENWLLWVALGALTAAAVEARQRRASFAAAATDAAKVGWGVP